MSSTGSILFIRADNDSSRSIERHLSSGGHEVRGVTTRAEAIGVLAEWEPDALLTACELPDGSAAELTPYVVERHPSVGVIVLAGTHELARAGRCVQLGAVASVPTPVTAHNLDAAIARALAHDSGDSATEDSGPDQVVTGTLDVIMATLEAKDPSLMGHSQRVAALAAVVADQMELDPDEVEQVRLAGRFHDLGKVGVSDELLSKRESHTEDELRQVRAHAALGAEMIGAIPQLGRVASFVRSHHEHFDGSGYPDGLAGEDIPLGGRILCAIEVFDALTTPGAGREPMGAVDAVRKMMDLEGKVLDPKVLSALAQAVAEGRNLPFMVEQSRPLNTSGIAAMPT